MSAAAGGLLIALTCAAAFGVEGWGYAGAAAVVWATICYFMEAP